MTAERDTERIVRSWLELGATRLPDHILDGVLDQLPATPQRRPWWPAWRFAQMNVSLKLAMGAAAIVLVACSATTCSPDARTPESAARKHRRRRVPRRRRSRSRHRTSAQTSPPGRYRLAEPFLQPVSLTLPAGWQIDQLDTGMVKLRIDRSGGAEIDFVIVDGVPLDPCHPDRGNRSPAPVTASGLEAAFMGMTGFVATPPLTTSIDGRQVRHFTISNSIDTSTAGCSGGRNCRSSTSRMATVRRRTVGRARSCGSSMSAVGSWS